MEKKKLLLVAVSVGVFLVIVVGAAILVFSPGGNSPAGTDWRSPDGSGLAAGQPATADPRDMLNAPELRGLQNPAPSVQEDASAELTIDRNTGTVITIQRPQTAAVPDGPGQSETKPAQAAPPKESQKKSVSPVVPAVPAPKPAASAAPPQKKTYRDFWIQAGSYSSRDYADSAKKSLDDKGISAVITNQEINGRTFYRVRIGPYTTQNEADYWLAMIKSINGFESSQVWETQSRR
jgi:DedD protein